jgi:type IV secretory pathway TrbL component
MSANRFVFTGLDELKAQLRALPAELTGEAAHIAEGAANGAAATIKAGYHVVSGELRDGVYISLRHRFSSFGVSATVVSAGKHAWLYDNGSQLRHKAGGSSTGVMWGKTPPPHLFVKTMIAARRRMYEQFKDLLTRKGLAVSGDA